MGQVVYKAVVSCSAWGLAIGGFLFFLLVFKYPCKLFDLGDKLGSPLDWLYSLAVVIVASLLPRPIIVKLRHMGSCFALFSVLVFFWVMNAFLVWFYLLRK